jgi:MFS family permease
MTLLTMPAGVLADRVPKRAVLIATQTAAMLLAFALAALTYWKVVTVWHVAIIGFLLGVTNAFDMPTRQSFVVDMVGKDDLMNAIALNSSMFHAARVIGPAIAGVLIMTTGEAGCFFLNGLSFLAVIAAYVAMRLPPMISQSVTRSLKRETLEAVHYVWGNPVIRDTVLLMAVVSLFALPYIILMPVFARDILKAGPKGLGYLLAANGVGAFFGALTLAAIGDTPHYRRLFFSGLFGFTVMTFAFSFSRTLWLSAILLLGAGWAMTISFAIANTVVQLRTPDELRGRVMGIYVLAFIGLGPFGSLLAGAIAHAISTPFAVAFGAVVCTVAALIVVRLLPREPASAA